MYANFPLFLVPTACRRASPFFAIGDKPDTNRMLYE